jgi:Domain of unknown function (DUF4440)
MRMTSTMRALLLATIALMAVEACVSSSGNHARSESTAAEIANARAEIWSKELLIYAARGRGDLDIYISNASPSYLGWPPGWATPSGLDQLRAGAAQMKTQTQEQLTMTQDAFTMSGDTAIIYYSTHRTRLPGGEAVDQRFDVTHVWVREGGQWKLLGSMGRGKLKP